MPQQGADQLDSARNAHYARPLLEDGGARYAKKTFATDNFLPTVSREPAQLTRNHAWRSRLDSAARPDHAGRRANGARAE